MKHRPYGAGGGEVVGEGVGWRSRGGEMQKLGGYDYGLQEDSNERTNRRETYQKDQEFSFTRRW